MEYLWLVSADTRAAAGCSRYNIDVPAEQFTTFMSKQIKDINRFAEHAVRTLPAAFRKTAPVDEWSTKTPVTVIEKVLLVIQYSISKSRREAAFQLMIILKAFHQVNSPRLHRGHDSTLLQEKLSTMIRDYVHGTASGNVTYFTFDAGYIGRGLVSATDRCTTSRTHWNFALAARTLRTHYCIKLGSCYGHSHGDLHTCFHMTSVRLLEWLQQKAWSETRYRTFCTVGTLLPAELTERIFEYALATEEIPEDPSMDNASTIRNAQTPDRSSGEHHQGASSRWKENLRLKKMWRCNHMRYDWDSSYAHDSHDSNNLPSDFGEDYDGEDIDDDYFY